MENIAIVCHEANRAYCRTIGEISQPSWNDAPEWQKRSAIKGVRFHLESLAAGITPSPSASHEAWMNEKRGDRGGWKYGPVKNAETQEHPCFLPYAQLPIEQRMKDYIFAAIVESIYRANMEEAKPKSFPQDQMSWTEVANQLEVLISKLSPESVEAWEWGATKSQIDTAHMDDFYQTLRETREHFNLEVETEIHGVFVEGTDLKLAITGNSPTAAARAEYLAAVSPKNITALIAYIREKEGNNGE